jgi:transcriptional regulator with XRE-family HTH domain
MTRGSKVKSGNGKNVRSATRADQAIGVRVHAMRNDLKMSQAELGDALGVTFQQVQKYEKGINRIGAARLAQIAVALKTTVAQLLGTDGATSMKGGDDLTFDTVTYKLAKELKGLHPKIANALRLLAVTIKANGGKS